MLPFADLVALAAPPQQQGAPPGKKTPVERSYDAKPAPPPPGPKSPIEGTPLGVSFVDVVKGSGLDVVTTYGAVGKNKYLLETTGCGLAFYDYDKSDVRSDAREALSRDADLLKGILSDFPSNTIMVEGHCDERGSAEYNLGLGDRRATAAKDFLVQLGTPGDKLRTISYGKERPQCTESNESCWQRNRRDHFVLVH